MSAPNQYHWRETERMVVCYLKDNGFEDARTTRAALGHNGTKQPGDISFEPGICLEVKSRKASAWPTWRAQCVAEAQGRVPVVLRRTRGVTDVGQWRCQVPVAWESATRLAATTRIRCKRTDVWWVELPFFDVVAELRRQHLTPVPDARKDQP